VIPSRATLSLGQAGPQRIWKPRGQLAEDAAAHESRWLALVQQPSDDLLLGAGQAEMARLAVTQIRQGLTAMCPSSEPSTP